MEGAKAKKILSRSLQVYSLSDDLHDIRHPFDFLFHGLMLIHHSTSISASLRAECGRSIGNLLRSETTIIYNGAITIAEDLPFCTVLAVPFPHSQRPRSTQGQHAILPQGLKKSSTLLPQFSLCESDGLFKIQPALIERPARNHADHPIPGKSEYLFHIFDISNAS